MHWPTIKYIFCAFIILLVTIQFADSHSNNNNNEEEEQSHSTSIAAMTQLLNVEANLIKNLNNYADLLQKKVDILRSAVIELEAENMKSQQDTETIYLSNPLNGFALIRRMFADWTYWQLFIERPLGQEQIDYIVKMKALMPTRIDMNEAATAIYRIQKTYDLKVMDMAVGLLNGKKYNASLSTLDCYAMGMHLFDLEKYIDASHWFNATIQSFRSGGIKTIMGLDRAQVLQIYAATLMKLNRQVNALEAIDMALADKPHEPKLLHQKTEIEFSIKTATTTTPSDEYIKISVPSEYERGCRGEYPKVTNLHCRYNATGSPFLRIAPLKLEEVGHDPYMILYHDAIYDSEINELQEIARPILKRATVYNITMQRNVVQQARTSKFAWLHDTYNTLMKRINNRIGDMTGFDLSGSEMLQVMNYGLGGHYDLHYDFFNLTSDSELVRMQGDRIATVLFYLNDVEQGGATVFPHIQKAVFPQKGTAIIWYNLNNKGIVDWRTMHAACPVIVGSKWVTNKWIRQNQQIFRWPCYKMDE